ncbi:MAG: acyl-ACP thioesterase domain-containing protein [Rikenellaceae bacterium]
MICYKENLKVKSYETDINANLKLYSFLNFAQEIAGLHADSLGFGYDNLIKSDIVWVLSRMHVKFLRLPKWKEEITLETWHKGTDRLFGFRDFEVSDSAGKKIILATSSWLIINTNTRKLQRMDNMMGENFKVSDTRHAIEKIAEKLVSPPNMEFVRKRVVAFSDVDINTHTNNAKYIEWALDCLETDVIIKIKISDLVINFNTESRLGDEVEFYKAEGAETIFIEGKRGDHSIFQVKLSI